MAKRYATTQDYINKFLGSVPDSGMADSPNMTNAQIFGVKAAGQGSTAAATGGSVPSPYSQPGYWTEGKIVNGTNVGGGVFVQGTPPPGYGTLGGASVAAPVTPAPTTAAPARTPSLMDKAYSDLEEAQRGRENARRQAEAWAAQQRQIRIDAINAAFAPRLDREREEGNARMSRVAALNFNAGIVGSGADTTKNSEQKGLNNKAMEAIENQRALAINEVFGWADKAAMERAKMLYEDSVSDANINVDKYKRMTDEAKNAIKSLGAQGVDATGLKTVDPKVYETLRDVSGMSDAQIDAYLKVNAPEGTYQWDAAQMNGSKMMVPKVVNGKVTMESIEYGFDPGKEFKTAVKTDSGVFVIYNDGSWDNIGGADNPKDEVLSVADAKALGVPYGTTSSQAYGKTPTSGGNTDYTIPSQSRNNLLKSFQPSEVDALQQDIREYGLDAALQGLDAETQRRIHLELDKDYNFYSS